LLVPETISPHLLPKDVVMRFLFQKIL